MTRRDYQRVIASIVPDGDRNQRMRLAIDALWNELHDKGCSWIGFYLKGDADDMILGPRRDKPACSPIGLHGACGKCFLSRRPLIVPDVAKLGAGYIACDPRDRSEAVLPCIDDAGECWGVLDADSFDLSAFDEDDIQGLSSVLRHAGLSFVDARQTEVV